MDFQTLDVLGIKRLLGRWFEPDEVIVQGDTFRSIIISYGLWQRAFGGDPGVLGGKDTVVA
jgi:hypothetical protein